MLSSSETPQFVTLQVACETCEKTSSSEKSTTTTWNVTELALVILGVGCFLTVAATGIAFYVRGELGVGVPKAISGLGTSTLSLASFLGVTTNPQPTSIFSDVPKESLPMALADPGNGIATVIRHGLSGSSKHTRNKGLSSWGAAYAQAAPPEKLPVPQELTGPVTTMAPSIASGQSPRKPGLAALVPPPWMASTVRREDTNSWFGKRSAMFGMLVDDIWTWNLYKPIMVLLLMLIFALLSFGLSTAVRKGKGSQIPFDIKPENALAHTSPGKVLAEVDIMEAFDAFDYKRFGFIDRATVNHMLGHMALPGHLDAAAPYLGSVKKLFYDDFRGLALQPGPFADVIAERVNKLKQRKASDAQRSTAFDERCKFGFDVHAAAAAIAALPQGPHQLRKEAPSKGKSPGGRRSWAEMRADLALNSIPAT